MRALLIHLATALRVVADWCEGAVLWPVAAERAADLSRVDERRDDASPAFTVPCPVRGAIEARREEIRASECHAPPCHAPPRPIEMPDLPRPRARFDVELCIVCRRRPCAGGTLACAACLEDEVHA